MSDRQEPWNSPWRLNWHKNIVTCPACRGYNLERQWCEVCEGRGYVNKKESRHED